MAVDRLVSLTGLTRINFDLWNLTIMLILLIIILLVVGLIGWILLAPIFFVIDTKNGIYEIRIKSIGHLDIGLEQEMLTIDVQIFFIKRKFDIDLFKISKAKKGKKGKQIKKDKSEKKRSRFYNKEWNAERIQRVLNSFQIQTFRLNIDTHNYYHNALLYPVLYLINRANMNLNVNFIGNNEFMMVVKNRLSRILYTVFLN